jgi:hypothetical protein
MVASTVLFFLLLLAFGVMAFVVAWVASIAARKRMEAEIARGRRQRAWGGKDYDRVRTKYFDKERRARAARDRWRQTAPPPPPPPSAETDPPPAGGSWQREQDYRETLGVVGVELTAEVLREAYKQRVREYHPDRVMSLGTKIQILAEEETKRINEAYRFLRVRYGIRVEDADR